MLNEKCYYGNFKEYIYYGYDIREYMDNVFKFYFFINKSSDISPSLKDYVNKLDGKGLVRFYNQMKEPLEFITNDDFLYFYLDTIVEHKYKDLSLELYICYYLDKKYPDNAIKYNWIDILSKRYRKEIIELENNMDQ